MNNQMFEKVAYRITELDVGGEAERQLDITEARQALNSLLHIAVYELSIAELMKLIESELNQQ